MRSRHNMRGRRGFFFFKSCPVFISTKYQISNAFVVIGSKAITSSILLCDFGAANESEVFPLPLSLRNGFFLKYILARSLNVEK